MRRLNGVDALMLYSETPEIHMHTLKIGILDVSGVADYNFAMLRDVAYPRLMALSALRYRLVDIPLKLHHPMWWEDADIDLDYHLRPARVAPPGGRRELDDLIGEIASTPLDRTRPLWEMYVAEGLADDRVAIIHKVHHVLADGVASANQLARALQPDAVEEPAVAGPAGDPALRSTAQLLKAAGRDHAHLIRRLPRLVSETAAGISRVRKRAKERGPQPDLARNFAPPPTFLNHVVSPGRRFATAPLSLPEVKETGRHLGVTLNDIVLATAAGALRTLLLRYDGHADAPLIAGVPICTDASPDRLTGNEFTYMMPSLPVHIADPLERVKLTAVATKIAKESHQLLGPTVLPAWMSYLPPALAPRFFRMQASRMESGAVMNLTISNVAGPRDRGHVAGGVVSEIYSVGPVVTGSGMNITVWSYVDQLAISVLTDDRTLTDPHEATDALLQAFADIRRAAGLPGELATVGSTLPLAAASR
ncbi:wax ester/triacylglycerol synthase family O-acyltransferase [Mycolicibacterium sp. GF69]|uniref:WS/DGAT/MGAT family O-acyltransferase n=1 Tax=Mycolicibacterium sp. GF69 TaxID=2267251 RepID=UPI000DCC567B|nr:wax ester/triacylglycerol synthase family O-acyltransferase [Mycolicibacterium sp. GF69]RAV07313.1 wax ester/triacylglycerol synthase family O-acyltransferase [Mycolicibacterium sp. GF69]